MQFNGIINIIKWKSIAFFILMEYLHLLARLFFLKKATFNVFHWSLFYNYVQIFVWCENYSIIYDCLLRQQFPKFSYCPFVKLYYTIKKKCKKINVTNTIQYRENKCKEWVKINVK